MTFCEWFAADWFGAALMLLYVVGCFALLALGECAAGPDPPRRTSWHVGTPQPFDPATLGKRPRPARFDAEGKVRHRE